MPILGRMNRVDRIRVFLVEDVPAMRDRLREYFDEIDGVNVIGDAATPDDAIDRILETRPDLVILDYQLEGGTGIDVLRSVRPRMPETVFAVLTQHAEPQYRRACEAAGAGYVLDKANGLGCLQQLIGELRAV